MKKPIRNGHWIAFAFVLMAACAPTPRRTPGIAPFVQSLKREMREQINRDRAQYGLPPVAYDGLAAEMGDQHCREMLEEGYVSHWNLSGAKPYARYAQMGGNDFIAENISFSKFSSSDPTAHINVRETILKDHKKMLAEKAPDDGHRQTILNPNHTHVGIGLAFDPHRVVMTEEFLSRYVRFDPQPPRKARLADRIKVSGSVLDAAHNLRSITVLYEPLPVPMSVETLNHTNAYALPEERYDLLPRLGGNSFYEDGTTGDITVEDKTFQSPIPFFKGEEGIYTVVVWIYDEKKQPVPASNVSIRVTR
ncbi:MAG: CAP domain-containing protein [Candidatus Latescibacterota bacterium]